MPIDMSEFEAQFEDPQNPRLSKLMSNEDFDRLAFLLERLDAMDGEKEILAADYTRAEDGQREINNLLAVVRKIEATLLNRRRPFDELVSLLDKIKRLNRTNEEAYKRELQRILAEIAAQQKLIAERNAIDEATKDFPWRVGVDGKKALPHQIEGANRLVASGRGLLGDKPGLGKTLQAIMTIDMLRAQGKAQRVIIFTPKQVLADFERAFKRWTNPTFVHVLNQTVKGVQIKTEMLTMLKHWPQYILLTNYEVWRKDPSIHEAMMDLGVDTVIMDEAHVLKDPKAATTKKVRELIYAENLCPNCNGQNIGKRGYQSLCLTCEYTQSEFGEFCSVKNVFPMTGTPILNKPQELWPLLEMLDREAFPKEKYFLEDYCVRAYNYKTEKYYYTFRNGGSEELLKKLGMRYTARTRESAGVKMPPQEVKHHHLELDPEKYPRQHEFNRRLRDEARIAFSEENQLTTNQVLAWYTRMRQAASWPDGIKIKGCPHSPHCEDEFGLPNVAACPAQDIVFPPKGAPPVGESAMMDEAEDIVFEAVEDGDRIVVFSHFIDVLGELERRCEEKGLRHGKIVGKTPDRQRQIYIDDFNTNYTEVGKHNFDVLLCHYKTASVGLNLNGAQQILLFEREWNPGKEEQAMDRNRRIDSEMDSIVHLLHCQGTATDLIDLIHEQKKGMLDGFQADVDLQEAMRKFLEG